MVCGIVNSTTKILYKIWRNLLFKFKLDRNQTNRQDRKTLKTLLFFPQKIYILWSLAGEFVYILVFFFRCECEIFIVLYRLRLKLVSPVKRLLLQGLSEVLCVIVGSLVV